MNNKDQQTVIGEIKSLINLFPGKPVIAFDLSLISSKTRNASRSKNVFLEELNDLLAGTGVCLILRGVYVACEYEGSVCLLVKANDAVSATPKFTLHDESQDVEDEDEEGS